jgi:hypothetical protein
MEKREKIPSVIYTHKVYPRDNYSEFGCGPTAYNFERALGQNGIDVDRLRFQAIITAAVIASGSNSVGSSRQLFYKISAPLIKYVKETL